jgi:hypothetical protein
MSLVRTSPDNPTNASTVGRISSRAIYHRSVVPRRPVRSRLISFAASFPEPDDSPVVEPNDSCFLDLDDGGEYMRVLDFSTFFSYIGSDGEQTISSAQFIADTNPLSRNTSDFLLTILSRNR